MALAKCSGGSFETARVGSRHQAKTPITPRLLTAFRRKGAGTPQASQQPAARRRAYRTADVYAHAVGSDDLRKLCFGDEERNDGFPSWGGQSLADRHQK